MRTLAFWAALIACLCGSPALAQAPLPDPAQRNFWYRSTDENTAIVFVHGILSNVRDCWLDPVGPGQTPQHFWPEMISKDPEFGSAGIYLAGYHTSTRSANYDIRQSALDVRDALVRDRVLDKQNIVFVAHSTGGIVVRQMLTRSPELFVGKNVGIVLIASPSLGSYWANRANVLIQMFGNEMAGQLRRGDAYLTGLHADFRELLQSRRLRIEGIERCENIMIVPIPLWFDQHLVVDKESCATYFGEPRVLPNTTHFTAVKPDSRTHPAYLAVRDFYVGPFQFLVRSTPSERLDLEITLQAKTRVMRDTTVQFPAHTFRTETCTAAATDTTRYRLPSGWKLRSVVGPTVTRSTGTEGGVRVELAGDTAVDVIATSRGGLDEAAACSHPGVLDYHLALIGQREGEHVFPELSVTRMTLDPRNPHRTIPYPHPVSDGAAPSWTYRVSLRGTTQRTTLALDLTERRPENSGVRTFVTADGKLVVDATAAFK